MTKKTLKKNIRPAHMLAVLFLCFILYVGFAAVPAFLNNTLQTLQEPLNLQGYIRKINEQYSGMLETGNKYTLPHNKGSYIDLNGFMAKSLGQPMMNGRVTLKNGHLEQLYQEVPDPSKIQEAADNIIDFHNTHIASGGDFLFVMVPSQISKYEDLLPPGYTDTGNETADAFLAMLENAEVPILDLREQMQIEGMSVTDHYYRTDHHWKPQTGFWAFQKIINKLSQMQAIEAMDAFYTDPANYVFETHQDAFLGSSGKRTGRFYAGLDDAILIRPSFETNICVTVPEADVELQGSYEKIAYRNLPVLNYQNPNFYRDNVYGLYGWGDTQITHWRNEHAPVQEKFLLIGESFGNIPFSLMSLCFSSCDEIDMRHFTDDFSRYYHSYNPETVIMLFYVDSTLSTFTSTSYLG